MKEKPIETRPHHYVYLDRKNCCIRSIWDNEKGTRSMSGEYNAITGKPETSGIWYDPEGDRPHVEYWMEIYRNPPVRQHILSWLGNAELPSHSWVMCHFGASFAPLPAVEYFADWLFGEERNYDIPDPGAVASLRSGIIYTEHFREWQENTDPQPKKAVIEVEPESSAKPFDHAVAYVEEKSGFPVGTIIFEVAENAFAVYMHRVFITVIIIQKKQKEAQT